MRKEDMDGEGIGKVAGFPEFAAVKRTADKMYIREEYHQALGRSGVTLDWLASGIKEVADNPMGRDSDRLAAFKMLLGSLGLDRMEDMPVAAKGWEETVLRMTAREDPARIGGDYEVVVPKLPEERRRIKEAEAKVAREMREERERG